MLTRHLRYLPQLLRAAPAIQTVAMPCMQRMSVLPVRMAIRSFSDAPEERPAYNPIDERIPRYMDNRLRLYELPNNVTEE